MHGILYKPHSQGVCERVHRAIKTGLIVKRIKDRNKFNISEALEVAINSYNKTIHNVIKAVPNEVFWSTKEKFLNKIKQNIINYSNKDNEFL